MVRWSDCPNEVCFLSATIALVIDTDIDFRSSESRELFTRVKRSFLSCMGSRGPDQASREIRRVAIEGLQLVELEGPWGADCYVGSTTLQLGFGLKWGVFLEDAVDRTACLRETICLARAVRSSRFVGFANQDYGLDAYELALAGSSFDDVVEAMSSARRVEVTGNRGLTAETISERLGVLGELLEEGYFVVRL